ncbi:MAG: TSUP family transporter, partial [Candidatus Syntrophosphaera sp.]
LAGLAIGFYDGFFGPGTGTFLILIYTLLMHYDFMVANGNAKVMNLASNLAALTTFLFAGKVWFALAIPAAACGIAGNLLGSKLVIKNGNRLIRPIFILALILLLGRIVYDLVSA